MVELRPGARFQSTVCTTEVIVIKGVGTADITCGSAPMVPAGSQPATVDPNPDASAGSLLGKRYGDPDGTVEVLCTKGGSGSLALAGTAMEVKVTTPLPASD